MAKVTIKDVEHVAKLARLGLSDAEKDKFTGQLSSILDYADKINELKTDGVPPTPHPLPLTNVFRDDIVKPCDDVESIMKNAPLQEDHMFLVPRMFEE